MGGMLCLSWVYSMDHERLTVMCGIKTSEFYVTVLALVIAACLALYGVMAGEIAAVMSVPLSYIAGRSYVKKGAEK